MYWNALYTVKSEWWKGGKSTSFIGINMGEGGGGVRHSRVGTGILFRKNSAE
jgi:hypothetical protein